METVQVTMTTFTCSTHLENYNHFTELVTTDKLTSYTQSWTEERPLKYVNDM